MDIWRATFKPCTQPLEAPRHHRARVLQHRSDPRENPANLEATFDACGSAAIHDFERTATSTGTGTANEHVCVIEPAVRRQ